MTRNVSPNWFATVMGTGIVANAAALLPVHVAGLHTVAVALWLLAAGLLIVLLGLTVVHWMRFRETAQGHHRDPAMLPFYGAPPMAMLTVGAGALLVGRSVLGPPAAVDLDEVLWTAGTLAGLVCATVVPYLMFTHHTLTLDHAFGGWLMAIVPPMVSAATGAGLIAHLPAGQDRLTLLLACYAMFGFSLVAALVVIALLVARLGRHGVGEARLVPTLWIVLGPLGQSVTATGLLAKAAPSAIAAPYAAALRALGVVYGVPVWGVAIAWLVLAAAVTVRTAREHLPFSLAWWSFTFPVGTVVTGTSELAVQTGAHVLTAASAALYGLLVVAWVTAAGRTVALLLLSRRGGRATSPASRVATGDSHQGSSGARSVRPAAVAPAPR